MLAPMDWDALREREFPRLLSPQGFAYLDYAYRGLVPASVVAVSSRALAACDLGRGARRGQESALARLRGALLQLLGWDRQTHGVCLTANTTAAIAALVGAIRWRPGERVLLHADEAASNQAPWEAAARAWGLELEVLPSRAGSLDLEDLGRACRRPVAWASLAAVTLGSGDRRPLDRVAALVQGAGGRLCVDAAQALGAVDLRGSSADAVVGCGRKWLCGPPEVGFLALRQDLAATLDPITRGGRSGAGDHVGAMEGGLPPVIPAIGLLEALDVFGACGWERIYAAVAERTRSVLAHAEQGGWTPSFPHARDRQGPVVWFDLPDGSEGWEEVLEAQGAVARVLGGRLRVAPHAWTAPEEIAHLFAVLGRLRGTLG